MNRRDAINYIGLITGSAVIGSQAFLTQCTTPDEKTLEGVLNGRQIKLLNEIGETILPKTERTPGAREVNVGSFMNSIVSDFYSDIEKKTFLTGLNNITSLSNDTFNDDYEDLSSENRSKILMLLEKEAAIQLKAPKTKESQQGDHYYIMFKQLTIWGYLSSEKVAMEAFNHIPIPGRYDGCVPFKEGDKPIFNESGSGQARGYALRSIYRS